MSSVKYLDPSSSTSDEADKTESTERSEIYITFRKISFTSKRMNTHTFFASKKIAYRFLLWA